MTNYQNSKQYLEDFNDALNQQVSVPSEVEVTPEGAVVKSETTYTVRELICSLLAGNGIKLPNYQICLKVNLREALNELSGEKGKFGSQIDAAIDDAIAKIEEAEAALDDFMEHTGIEETLERANKAIAEFAAVANMINFCGTPITPRPIPNVLDDAFGAFTGAGKDLLRGLGDILDSDIGGCIGSGGFNFGLFQGGTLKSLGDVLTDLGNGVTSGITNRLNSISSQLDRFSSDMRDLISLENNFGSTANTGGSTFVTNRVNSGVGIRLPENMDLQTAQRYASNLKSAYDQLSAYKLSDGKHLFEHILEPELLTIISNTDGPNISVGDRSPVYDYCGRVIGYTNSSNTVTETSSGSAQQPNTQPGTTATVIRRVPPETSIGRTGDSNGDIAYDNNYMYVAVADYDGTTNIWIRTPLDTSW